MADPRKPIRQREIEGALNARVRGAIVKFLAEQERRPAPRHTARLLMGLLRRLMFDVVLADVIQELEYLESRGYIEYEAILDDEVRRLPEIGNVRLTANGRDLYEGKVTDAGVELD